MIGYPQTNHSARIALAAVTILIAIGGKADAAVTHTQRLHSPANVAGNGIEIEPISGGYMYVANHTTPYTLPANFNRRPVLVRSDPNLAPLAAFTYIKPGETTTAPALQLFLDATDMFKTDDNGFILCGNYMEGDEMGGGGLQYGAWLLRVDGATMQPIWFRQYPGTLHFNSVVQTRINGLQMYAIAGDISSVTLDPNPLLAGFDALGNIMWTQEYVSPFGGYGTANEVIVYDANSVAMTGFMHGGSHHSCSIEAYADVLVVRCQNDGTPQFTRVYGQTTATVGGDVMSVVEKGATLTRPNGSPDLVIAGKTQAWSTTDQCPGSPAYNDMLVFRINPAGTVIWSHRYGLAGGWVSGVQIKPISTFLAIIADTNSLIGSTYSENVGYFRLMAGGGSLAQQTEVFGGTLQDSAAGIIPLGPPYPFRAVMIGTSISFGSSFPKPYLIERQVFAEKKCNDAMRPTTIVPVLLPQLDVFSIPPFIPMTTQPLVLLTEPITDTMMCGNQSGGGTGNPTDPIGIDPGVIVPPHPLIDPGHDGIGPGDSTDGVNADDDECPPCEALRAAHP